MNISVNTSKLSILKLAGSLPNGQGRTIRCFVKEMSGQVLTLDCQDEPAISAAVSLEHNDAMLLGEVVSVCRQADGRWHVQVMVEQILTGLNSLIALRDHLLGESTGARRDRRETRPCVYA